MSLEGGPPEAGKLVRVGGILLQTGDAGLRLGNTGLEPPAVGTFGYRCICHDPAEYPKPEAKSIRLSRNP